MGHARRHEGTWLLSTPRGTLSRSATEWDGMDTAAGRGPLIVLYAPLRSQVAEAGGCGELGQVGGVRGSRNANPGTK